MIAKQNLSFGKKFSFGAVRRVAHNIKALLNAGIVPIPIAIGTIGILPVRQRRNFFFLRRGTKVQ